MTHLEVQLAKPSPVPSSRKDVAPAKKRSRGVALKSKGAAANLLEELIFGVAPVV